jgi:hypothetical protein
VYPQSSSPEEMRFDFCVEKFFLDWLAISEIIFKFAASRLKNTEIG